MLTMIIKLTFNDIVQRSGLSLTKLSVILGIPYRTIQDWNSGKHKCPDYVLHLIEYKLKNEGLI